MGKAVKTYINVAYKDRDLAKRLGARWDPSVKRWYCPSDSTLALIYMWRTAPVSQASISQASESQAAPAKVPAAANAGKSPTTRSVRKVTPGAGRPSGSLPGRAPSASPLFGGNLELPLAS